METAYWSPVSWKVGLEQGQHGKLPTAVVGLPGGVPEQPGAGDAGKQIGGKNSERFSFWFKGRNDKSLFHRNNKELLKFLLISNSLEGCSYTH